MKYERVPPIGSLSAPALPYMRSANQSSRHGQRVELVFLHRWGNPDSDFAGNVAFLRRKGSGVSSHVVYAGERGPYKGKAAQLVPWGAKAWTQCDLNPRAISFETADAIWLGSDPIGFARLARMVALVLHVNRLPVRWVHGAMFVNGGDGFLRHGDAGRLGCGHLFCPTSDLQLWRQFVNRVVAESRHGGFRKTWGRA